MFKLLVILYVIKLHPQINIYILIKSYEYTQWNICLRKTILRKNIFINEIISVHACRTCALVIVLEDELPSCKVNVSTESV